MAQLWVPGPAEIHVDTGSGLLFYGWSEDGVGITLNPRYEDVMADIGGTLVPTDQQFMGETALVRARMKVFNTAPQLAMLKRINFGGATARGAAGAGGIGTLLKGEANTFRLLVYPPYATSKAAMSTLPTAWNFLAASLAGPDEFPQSTRAQAVSHTFFCQPVFGSDGSYTLYNAVSTGRVAP